MVNEENKTDHPHASGNLEQELDRATAETCRSNDEPTPSPSPATNNSWKESFRVGLKTVERTVSRGVRQSKKSIRKGVREANKLWNKAVGEGTKMTDSDGTAEATGKAGSLPDTAAITEDLAEFNEERRPSDEAASLDELQVKTEIARQERLIKNDGEDNSWCLVQKSEADGMYSNDPKKRPIKVYILAGQSNMLEMGTINGGSHRFSNFYASGDPAVNDKGLVVSVYKGDYNPNVDYGTLEPTAKKLVAYDGKGTDSFPGPPKKLTPNTYIARGFILVSATGHYAMSPGWRESSFCFVNFGEDASEVYRLNPMEQEPTRTSVYMEGGKRYPIQITFLTRIANGLFWLGRTDTPGTLDVLVKEQGRFQYLLDEETNSKYVVRKDVYFLDARMCGGWNWDKDDPNKMVLDVEKLKKSCRPLTVEPKGLWLGVPFGCIMGDYHGDGGSGGRETVLIVRSAIGNRGLAWDFRPPSSGKSPNIPDDTKKWEGVEYYMMVEGVRQTLANISDIIPDYNANQKYEIAGFGWFQGHKDTGNKDWAEAYEANMVNLIQDLRKDLQVPDLPAVIATIGFDGHDMNGLAKIVWQAQMNVGDPEKHPELGPLVIAMDTRDFWRPRNISPSGQGYHYNRNAETYVLVGEALASGMKDLLERKKAAAVAGNGSL